jgi:hypothetical protein
LPSADGQEAVIRKAYLAAGIPLDDTTYVEVRLSRWQLNRYLHHQVANNSVCYRPMVLGPLLETLLKLKRFRTAFAPRQANLSS